ncbi:hypothetical protein [Embleya sp. NPDC020630]|uniref:hypothetical protein n=1 Tax=Embleya sp. NPDC020630 TaxID=3363979 RepID=UPI00378E75E5
MSLTGTDAYRDHDALPPLLRRTVEAARRHGFAFSCRPEQGRLLQLTPPPPGTEPTFSLPWSNTARATGSSADQSRIRAGGRGSA